MLSGCFIRAESLEDTRRKFQRFLDLGMGDFICLNTTGIGADGAMEMVKRLVDAKVHFILNGNVSTFTPATMKELEELAGEYYVGTYVISEIASLIYWDRDYFKTLTRAVDWKAALGEQLLGAEDLEDARRRYMAICEELVNSEEMVTRYVGPTKHLVVDSGLYQKPLLDAGCEFPCVELAGGIPEMIIAGTRGAIRSKGKEMWMGYIPECYMGLHNDTLRAKRFFLFYMNSYIAGAGIALRESGTFHDRGRTYDSDRVDSEYITSGYDDFDTYYNDDYKRFRDVTAAVHKFTRQDGRPAGGPRTPLGIIKGRLDGFVGMWDRRVWGQHHAPEWEHSDVEREWEYFWQLYRRRDWSDIYHYGEEDFSGNPPCGQVDIVPGEAPLEVWRRYRTLMLLGWNTMTDDLYEKMKRYVSAGGRLILSTSHMRVNTKRGEPMRLFRDGDFRDLFGVSIKGPSAKRVQGVRFIEDLSWCSGLPVWQSYSPEKYSCDPVCINGPIVLAEFDAIDATVIACGTTGFSPDTNYPVIVENKLGRGSAVLVSTWTTPGEMPMELVMRTLVQVVSTGEERQVRLAGGDRLRYAVYGERDGHRIYVLNTDHDGAQACRLHCGDASTELLVQPCALQVLQFEDGRFHKRAGISYAEAIDQD